MKVAITSLEDKLDSSIDSRFGRCAYFAIYDTETQFTQFIKNPHKDDNEGAGPASAQFILSKGISKVISGLFGGKAKSVFESLHIEMIEIEDSTKKISEIINSLHI